jgi:hypothetical protein
MATSFVDESLMGSEVLAFETTEGSWPGMAGAGEVELRAGVRMEDRVTILDVRCRLARAGASEDADSPDDDPSPLQLPPSLSSSSSSSSSSSASPKYSSCSPIIINVMLTSLGWNTILPGCWDYYICAVNTKTIIKAGLTSSHCPGSWSTVSGLGGLRF